MLCYCRIFRSQAEGLMYKYKYNIHALYIIRTQLKLSDTKVKVANSKIMLNGLLGETLEKVLMLKVFPYTKLLAC